ncbi:MAG: hypothetical protein AAF570_11960 [Bacteroidota bacterium]
MKTTLKTLVIGCAFCLGAGLALFLPVAALPDMTPEAQIHAAHKAITATMPDGIIVSNEPTLYRHCLNPVHIWLRDGNRMRLPTLGPVEGASILPPKTPHGYHHLVPTGRTVTLSQVKDAAGNTVDVPPLELKVVSMPKPQIEFLVNERPYLEGMQASRKSRFTFKVVPDEEFRRALPEEARYSITEIDVLVQADLGTPKLLKTVKCRNKNAANGITFGLGQSPDVRPGRRVYFRLKKIERVNTLGKRITVTFPARHGPPYNVMLR